MYMNSVLTNIGELANLHHKKQPSTVIILVAFLESTILDGDDFIAIPIFGWRYCWEGTALQHDSRKDP